MIPLGLKDCQQLVSCHCISPVYESPQMNQLAISRFSAKLCSANLTKPIGQICKAVPCRLWPAGFFFSQVQQSTASYILVCNWFLCCSIVKVEKKFIDICPSSFGADRLWKFVWEVESLYDISILFVRHLSVWFVIRRMLYFNILVIVLFQKTVMFWK